MFEIYDFDTDIIKLTYKINLYVTYLEKYFTNIYNYHISFNYKYQLKDNKYIINFYTDDIDLSNESISYYYNIVKNYWGYKYLGNNPLIYMAIKDLDIKFIVSEDNNFFTTSYIEEDIDISDYIQEGYFAYIDLPKNKKLIYDKLITLWNIKLIEYNQELNIIVYKSMLEDLQNPKYWLDNAYEDILLGQYPGYLFYVNLAYDNYKYEKLSILIKQILNTLNLPITTVNIYKDNSIFIRTNLYNNIYIIKKYILDNYYTMNFDIDAIADDINNNINSIIYKDVKLLSPYDEILLLTN